MATLTASRAASTLPVFRASGAGIVCAAYGTYELASAPSANDIVEFCRVPKGAVILGGYLYGDDIDTGTETFEFDIGYAANGAVSADPDAFLNSGVITGDTFATGNLSNVAGICYPLFGVLKDGPLALTAETVITGTVTAAANSGGTGTLSVVVFYVVP
jgi:hypothetical protein